MIPKEINVEHILKAIAEIDRVGIRRKSTKYQLFYDGKRYPPKDVISLANKFANGRELKANEFHGGNVANKFLERLGFLVEEIRKIDDLIRIYINIDNGKNIQSLDNFMPNIHKEPCKDFLFGWVLHDKNFNERMSTILECFRICRHKKVFIVSNYWDGILWEQMWKEKFRAVGGEVFRKMLDGQGGFERIV